MMDSMNTESAMPNLNAPKELRPASFLRRLLALLIDLVILFGLFQIVLILLGLGILFVFFKDYLGSPELLMGAMFLDSTQVLYWVVIGVVAWMLLTMAVAHIYFIALEAKRGASLGKSFFGLKVVSVDGRPISSRQAVLRDLGRWYVDFTLVLPTVVALLVTKRRQRIGDLLAGPMVVHRTCLVVAQTAQVKAPVPEPVLEPEPGPSAVTAQEPVTAPEPASETPLERYLRKHSPKNE